MASTTTQPEVIEIPDSPTAHEVIEISDDDEVVIKLSDSGAKQTHIPRSIPTVLESASAPLVNTKSSGVCPMPSPGPVMSYQDLLPGRGNPAGDCLYLKVLDRELSEISRAIDEDHTSMITHILQDSGVADKLKFVVPNHMLSMQSLGPLHHCEAASPSIAPVYHSAKRTHPSRHSTKSLPHMPMAVPKYNHYVEINRSILTNRMQLPPKPNIEKDDSTPKEELEAAIQKSMLSCAKLAKQARRSEKLEHIGEYLPQIRTAYQDCRNNLEEVRVYEPLDRIEQAFGIPPKLIVDLETPAAKPQEGPIDYPDPVGKTLERYARESCLICSAHQCHIHGKFDDNGGESDTDASDTTDDTTSTGASDGYQRYNMPHTRQKTYYREGNSVGDRSESEEESGEQSQRNYCSEACYLNSSNAELSSEGAWTEESKAAIQLYAVSMRIGNRKRAPCLIAPMLSKHCSEVYNHLKKLRRVELHETVAVDDRRSKKLDWRDLQGPGLATTQGKIASLLGRNAPAVAMHDTLDVPVRDNAFFSKSAPVFSSTENATPISATNRGQAKKVLVGESAIEGTGNGLYLAESVQEGDFIAEYVGEIIDHTEVDRRDDLVKKMGMSYNFDLNMDVVIDAMWFGNATRFINHSEVRKNCRAKVLLVNSEHRIAFFATKNLNAGEELFFDYGKSFKSKEKLTEGVISPNARKTASKQVRTEPLENTTENTEAGSGSGVNEDDGQDDVFGDDPDWYAKHMRKRAIDDDDDDDDDYIEKASGQGFKRSRPSLRSRHGRR
ncbi:hypothetical protein O988_05065 [Pseudogymnoascus sp. VKM F-3808]|nr:hypothetical protein O988_05065 [Pseudogymnoascus sp. VKM F-3808]